MDRELIKNISEKIFSLFVVNTAAAGIQQKNGVYITKYIPVTPSLIESMILARGSMGCYQQGYKTGFLKWICLDFDCKEKTNPDLDRLYRETVLPITAFLDRVGIHYLTEFSGRRGIHIWIIFDHIIKKSVGYRILKEILRQSSLELSKEEEFWNLDQFPSTDSSKGNTVGKQVKFPLSTHRMGGMAYFFQGKFEYCPTAGTDSFFKNQYKILSEFQENNVEHVMSGLGLGEEYREAYSFKYKKYKIFESFDIAIDDLWAVLRETRVFGDIYDRMRRGQARPQDWTVLLGTLSPCDKEARLVRQVLREFPNYDEDKTSENIDKLKDQYYPATFGYLYYLYDIEIEDNLDPEMTGLEYLCNHFEIDLSELPEGKTAVPDKRKLSIQDTIRKEKDYLLYNDESPDIYIWNQLHLVKRRDERDLQEVIDSAIETGVFSGELEPFRVYKRVETENKVRTLISLSAKDRVITTYLALEFCREYRERWRSFSYRPALSSRKEIFYAWYRSWGNYIDKINTFIEVPFFEEYEIIFIDLKSFYDHIDFLTVYDSLQEELNEKASNILRYLISFNDSLMAQINDGSRIGVPQGPAYARIIAEVFLNKILSSIEEQYGEIIRIFRYVDDITIICSPGFDSKSLFSDICDTLARYGLPVNTDKSLCFGKIALLQEDQINQLLHTDHFNYDLRDGYRDEVMLLQERRKNLSHYLEEHSFDIRSLGYIFGSQTLQEAKEWCFGVYRKQIIASEIGRGSNFRRFYEYLFQNEEYLNVVLSEHLLEQIPLQSVNFSNFVDTLYLAVQNKEITSKSFERVKKEYLLKIAREAMAENDRTVLNALLMIRLEDSDDEL